MKLAALFLALALASCARGAGSRDPGWPRWRGPNGDGVSQETNWNPAALAGGPKVLWRAPVGVGYSNVAVDRNRVYTIGLQDRSERIACLDADTGREIWHYAAPGKDTTQSTPAVDGNSVYALTKGGLLVCLNATNGRLRWQRHLVKDLGAEELGYGYA